MGRSVPWAQNVLEADQKSFHGGLRLSRSRFPVSLFWLLGACQHRGCWGRETWTAEPANMSWLRLYLYHRSTTMVASTETACCSFKARHIIYTTTSNTSITKYALYARWRMCDEWKSFHKFYLRGFRDDFILLWLVYLFFFTTKWYVSVLPEAKVNRIQISSAAEVIKLLWAQFNLLRTCPYLALFWVFPDFIWVNPASLMPNQFRKILLLTW